MSSNAFVKHDPYSGVPGNIRYSLRKLNLEAKHILKMGRVLRSLKLKFDSPAWAETPDTWAHFGLVRKHKAVIVIGDTIPWITRKGFREDWLEHGVTLLAIARDSVYAMSEQALASQLAQALNIEGPTK